MHPLLYQFRRAFLKISSDKLPVSVTRHKKESSYTSKRQEASGQENLWPLQIEANMIKALKDKTVWKNRDSNTVIDHALAQASEFYEVLMGNFVSNPPLAILDSIEYQTVDPKLMLDKCKILGIEEDSNLYWIGRLFSMLPLPPL